MFDYKFLKNEQGFIAGVDEVGRGCLAGPVVCACLKLSYQDRVCAHQLLQKLIDSGVNDSKKLSSHKRRSIIGNFNIDLAFLKNDQKIEIYNEKKCQISIFLSEISNSLVDQLNVLNASLEGMRQAFEGLANKDEKGTLLVDGHICPDIPHSLVIPIIKGDQKSVLIGLASIFAKEYRDNYMKIMDQKYPEYNFKKHVGYGTKEHLAYLKKYGPCDIHRRTFRGVAN